MKVFLYYKNIDGKAVEFITIMISRVKSKEANESSKQDSDTVSFSVVEINNKSGEQISDFEDEETQNRWKNKKIDVSELVEKVFRNQKRIMVKKKIQVELLDIRQLESEFNTKSPRDSFGSGDDSLAVYSNEAILSEEHKHSNGDNIIKEVQDKSEEDLNEEEGEKFTKGSRKRTLRKVTNKRTKFKPYKEERAFGLYKEGLMRAKGSTDIKKKDVMSQGIRKSKTSRPTMTKAEDISALHFLNEEVAPIVNDEGKTEEIKSYISNWNVSSNIFTCNKKGEEELISPKQITEETIFYSSPSEDNLDNKPEDDTIALVSRKKNEGNDNPNLYTELLAEKNNEKMHLMKMIASSNKTEDFTSEQNVDMRKYIRSKTNENDKEKLQKRETNKERIIVPIKKEEEMRRSFYSSKNFNKKNKLFRDPIYGDSILLEENPNENEIAVRNYFSAQQLKKNKEENNLNVNPQNTKTKELDDSVESSKKSEDDSKEHPQIDSTVKPLYSIRPAVEEKFSPRIYKICAVILVTFFIIEASYRTVYYMLGLYFYDSCKNSLRTMIHTELRSIYLIDLNIHLRTRLVMSRYPSDIEDNPNLISSTEALELLEKTSNFIRESSIGLREIQTYLSIEAGYLNSEQKFATNLKGLKLQYRASTNLIQSRHTYSISQLITEIIISCFRILNLPYEELNEENLSVHIIANNSLSGVLAEMQKSSENLLNHLYEFREDMLLFLLVATIAEICVLLICKIIVIRMTLLIRKNKNDVFALFLKLSKEDVHKCQARCEKFKSMNKTVLY